MAGKQIATSKDIYLEADGKRIAAVQSYQVKAVKETEEIQVFGSAEPIAALPGKTGYTITLKKVVLQEETLDFYSQSGFSLVIVKPDRRILYTGCEWKEIQEETLLGRPCMESVVLTAVKRIVFYG